MPLDRLRQKASGVWRESAFMRSLGCAVSLRLCYSSGNWSQAMEFPVVRGSCVVGSRPLGKPSNNALHRTPSADLWYCVIGGLTSAVVAGELGR